MNIHIRVGHIQEAVAISKQIPEFKNPYEESTYRARLHGVPSLILIAEHQQKGIGFKVGYRRDKDGSFYSWMGGILPAYRRYQVARKLAECQERWARKQNYSAIRFKTRNKLKSMQIFALSRGFDIIQLDKTSDRSEFRIWLEKEL